MSKYRCTMCGRIYDEESEKIKFDDLSDSYVCPSCEAPKELFESMVVENVDEPEKEEVKEEVVLNNAIRVSPNNKGIVRIVDKCIDCGQCKTTCKEKEGFTFDENSELCLSCGQCIQVCPVGALLPKDGIDELKANLDDKICIAYTSPAVRVAVGEIFGKEPGTFEQSKLVGLLRMMGFKYVLDTTFGADLTICEEASELVNRILKGGILPMFTSCCPAWVKYCETFYPNLINNLSSCKSPIAMQGMIVKEYFTKKMNIDKDKIYTVAITPCTAKKYEISRDNIKGTDLVLTLLEIQKYVSELGIKYEDIKDDNFDSILGEGSGSGVNFGSTGGVATAALRTAYFYITNKTITDIPFVRINEYLSETSLDINGKTVNVAVINRLSEVKKILDDISNGNTKYQFIEIMNCEGGCIGGGGQPIIINNDINEKKKRITSLNNRGNNRDNMFSHHNKDIVTLYKELLKYPQSNISENLLHTTYIDRSSDK